MPDIDLSKVRTLGEIVNTAQSQITNEKSTVGDSAVLSIAISSVLTIFTFVLGYIFQILQYWVASSFLLILVWTLYSSITMSKQSKIPLMDEKTFKRGMVQSAINLRYSVPALVVIYFITLTVLLLMTFGIIPPRTANLLIPIIVAICICLSPIVTSKFYRNYENNKLGFIYRAYFVSKTKTGNRRELTLVNALGLLVFVALVVTIILYAWAFWITFSIIKSIWIVLLFTAIQFIVFLYLAKLFNQSLVKNELAKSTLALSKLQTKISKLILDGKCADTEYEELKREYNLARPYDIKIDETLRFIRFHFLMVNKDYFDEFSKQAH